MTEPAVSAPGVRPAERPLAVVVLAAGRGTRFPGVASKVLVELAGRSLLRRVLDAVATLAAERVVVVVGHGKEHVVRALDGTGVETVEQGEPRGTGHAVSAAARRLGDRAYDVVVVNGDVPLLRPETLLRLRATLRAPEVAAGLLTAVVDDPAAYGRIIRRADGGVEAIVEAADASDAELAIREINVGGYALRAPRLFADLAALGTDNVQGECYLTDAVRLLTAAGERVVAVPVGEASEALGVNSAADLAALEELIGAGAAAGG